MERREFHTLRYVCWPLTYKKYAREKLNYDKEAYKNIVEVIKK